MLQSTGCPSGGIKIAPVRIINLKELEIIAGDLAADRYRLADVCRPGSMMASATTAG